MSAGVSARSGQPTVAAYGRFRRPESQRNSPVAATGLDRSDVSASKPTGPTSDQFAGAVKLYVAVPARADLGRVPEILGSADADWLGERVSRDTSEIREFSCDLELRVGPDRWATFRKAAIVGLRAPRRDDDVWLVPIEWRAATLAPLFPVFVGVLRLSVDRIELDGRYAPPGGTIGYVLDRALLHIAARGTGRWFLQKVLLALDGDLVAAGGGPAASGSRASVE